MPILVADTFTAANGTAINGRTPDTTVGGATWSTFKGFTTGSPTTPDIQSNKATIYATDDSFGLDCGDDDYTIIWYCTLPASGQFRGGCRFRIQHAIPFVTDPSDIDYYFFNIRFDLGSGNIRLTKVVNKVETVIGSDVTMAFSYNTTYKMTLVVSGTTYTLYIDDVLKKSETETTYGTGSIVGFGAGAVSGNNFTLDSVQIGLGATVPVIYHHLQQQGIGD